MKNKTDVKFIYPRWGSNHLPWESFLEQIKTHGYYGVEIDLPENTLEQKKILKVLKRFDLKFVGQHWETRTSNFKAHKEQLKRQLYNLAEAQPLLINSHTGLDFFSFSQNVELLEMAHNIEQETKVPITHETHRSRFAFAAHVCIEYLKALPFLKLTSDFSHWCCVAESLLQDQLEAVEKAITHTYHIHARVGSAQSPQVIDPRAKIFKAEREQFVAWWLKMIDAATKNNQSILTITPEFGPVPYMSLDPKTELPLASQWEVNQYITSEIKNALK